MLGEIEALRAERNRVSKEIPQIKDKAEKQRPIEEMRQVGDRIKALEADLQPVQERLRPRPAGGAQPARSQRARGPGRDATT